MGVEILSNKENEIALDLQNLQTEVKGGGRGIAYLASKIKEGVKYENYLRNIPKNIKDIALEKLNKDPDFTDKIIDKYNMIQGPKPDFFPFFCSCKGAKNLNRRLESLVIQDFSTLTPGGKVPQNAKAYRGSQIMNGKLYIIQGNKSIMVHSPIGMGSITKSKGGIFTNNGTSPALFANADVRGSNKSELGFSIVKNGKIKMSPNVGPYLDIEGQENCNKNMGDNDKYAHTGTWSMGCVVVPPDYQDEFFSALKNNGTLFTYAPNVEYFSKSTLV